MRAGSKRTSPDTFLPLGAGRVSHMAPHCNATAQGVRRTARTQLTQHDKHARPRAAVTSAYYDTRMPRLATGKHSHQSK